MSGDLPPAGRLTPRNVALSDEAIDWIVQLGSGSATDDDRAAFEKWCARSPAHADAAAEAKAILHDVGSSRVADEYRDIGNAIRHPVASRTPRRFNRRVVLTGGAATAALAGVVSSGIFGPPSAVLADHSTGVGERKRLALDDGSVVWLNTSSALSIEFSANERRLVLHAGEAFFEVAKDRNRPFIVASGGGEARAVGTQYSVRQRGFVNDVVVKEGIVEVRSGGEAVRLIAGQSLAYGDGILSRTTLADSDAMTAWSRGKLIFKRQPLADVAAELERYQFGKVIVRGERLKRLQVTGVFELDDTSALLRSIAQTVNVRVVQLPLLTIIG